MCICIYIYGYICFVYIYIYTLQIIYYNIAHIENEMDLMAPAQCLFRAHSQA